MKRESRLRYMIKNGLLDIFTIWLDEMKKVFRDDGVRIFFFLVPFGYPLLYTFIYNNEVIHEAKMVVVDQSDSYWSREFTRRVNGTADVQVVSTCTNMNEAKTMLDKKKAYGILYIPSDFDKDLHREKQATVSLYVDMSSLLYYKAFLMSATEVSLDIGNDLRMHTSSAGSAQLDRIMVEPIPYDSVALFNSQNGFASFLVPGILILILQQTLVLGIGLRGGTEREKNRFHTLVPISKHFNGTFRVVMGKALTYLLLYVINCIWVLWIVPRMFSLPQVGDPMTVVIFLLPFLCACIFFAMTLSGIIATREAAMIYVFSSVIMIFISGISWPESAVPPFWKFVGLFIPSTPGIQGFVGLNTCGASLSDVAKQYHLLWLQTGIYFITTCLIYRYQIIKCHKQVVRQYRYMKMRKMLEAK